MTLKTSVLDLIGNTPLLKLKQISEETGCEILGKCEFLNPGQSVKDRPALEIVRAAERDGSLKPGGTIVEELIEVDAVPYKNPNHYARYSGRLAEELNESELGGAIWANQFDNTANRDAHYKTTGPEIWQQTEGKVDGFICAVGSGGTLAGTALSLRELSGGKVKIGIADPGGAALYEYYKNGELKSEGTSITEGIGQGRVTENLVGLDVDYSYRIHDKDALTEIYTLIENEGLCLGGSAGINIAGARALAKDLGPGHTIVTILCDYGNRYQDKLFNPDFLRTKDLPTPPWME